MGFLENQDRGSRIEDRGSRIKDRGSRIEDRGSKIEDRGSRIEWKKRNKDNKIMKRQVCKMYHACSELLLVEEKKGKSLRDILVRAKLLLVFISNVIKT